MENTNGTSSDQWNKVGSAKRYGVSIPVYALHSKTTYGIGEFQELIRLFPWLKSMGFSAVQLPPLYDTAGMADPHLPYSPFALNPLFLSLTEIPHSSDKEELYLQRTISYSSAAKFKETLLVKFYYDHRDLVFKSDAFMKFCDESPWLDDYVGLKGKDPKFHQFVQFLCHQQLKQVQSEAEKQGILLIGETPTRLKAEGPDVKYHPNWFIVSGDEAECDWQEMEKDGYSWWKERLQHAANYYDACKFDHPIDSHHFIEEISEDLPLLLVLNESQPSNSLNTGSFCPVATYPNSEEYPAHSLTILARPSKPLSKEQCKKLIIQSHSTDSLLHMVPLTTYISFIPDFNWTASNDDLEKWNLSIKPSVEELISSSQLKEEIQECLAF